MLAAGARTPRQFEVLVILLLGLTPLLWYGPGTIIFGHDTGFSLDPGALFEDRLFTWTERSGLGYDQSGNIGALPIHGLEALAGSLGFSLTDIQKITFSFWFVVPGLSIYALLHYLDARDGAWVFRLTGSTIYMFNHFLLQAWFVAERTKFSLVAALPLVVLLVMRAADSRTGAVRAGVLIGVTLGVFNGGGFLPLYGAVLISSLVSVLFFALPSVGGRGGDSLIRMVKLSIAATLTFLLVNAYWILPQTYDLVNSYSSRVAGIGGIDSIVSWAGIISAHASPLNLLRLQGISAWYSDPHPYSGAFLGGRALIAVSALLPLMAFTPLLRQPRHVDRRYVLFFALLALVAMIFTGGTHPPLGFIYRILLEEVPGFAVFRTPYYKFAPALWLGYAVLVALSVAAIVEWARGRIASVRVSQFAMFGLGTMFIAAVLAYDYPIFSRSHFDWAPPLTTMIRVPDHVFDFGRWSEGERPFGRVVLVPPVSDLETYNWGYMSHSLVPSYFAPTFANTAGGLTAEERALVDDVYVPLKAGDTGTAVDRASLLGARYFLLRGDVLVRQPFVPGSYGVLPPEERPAVYEPILRLSDDLSLVEQWGEWSLYEIVESRALPQIYAARPEFLKIAGQDRARVFPFSTGAPPKILFQRINPTKYLVQIRNATSPFALVLGTRHATGWKIYQSPSVRTDIAPIASHFAGEVQEGAQGATLFDAGIAETWTRRSLPEEFHMEVNGYANGWYLTNTGSYDLIIEYWPQRLFQAGLATTIVSTGGILGYFAPAAVRGLRRRERDGGAGRSGG